MEIGKLRHRITLQRQTYTQNSYGAAVIEWHDVATVWAEVKPISGREQFLAQQVQSEISTQIWLRYRADVVPTMRIKHGKQTYEVLAVLNHQGRNITLQLLCQERINGQNDGEN